MTYNQLIDRISQASVPDIGDVISQAFELFKKAWLQGFLYVLFTCILVVPIVLIIYTPFLGLVISESEGVGMSEHFGDMAWLPSLPIVLLFGFGIFFVQAVVMAMQAGLYRSFDAAERGETFRAGMLFEFLKGRYLVKTFVLSLLAVVLVLAGLLFCLLPVLYVWVPISFFAVVFAFSPDLGIKQIVLVAFKLGNKTWIVSFVLMILAAILSQVVGFLTCGLGILFSTAFIYMVIYHIYKDVLGGKNEGEEPGILMAK